MHHLELVLDSDTAQVRSYRLANETSIKRDITDYPSHDLVLPDSKATLGVHLLEVGDGAVADQQSFYFSDCSVFPNKLRFHHGWTSLYQ